MNSKSENISIYRPFGKDILTLGFIFLLYVLIIFLPALIHPKLIDPILSFKIMVALEFVVGFATYVLYYSNGVNPIRNRGGIFFISLAVLICIQLLSYIFQSHDIGSIKITSDNALSLFMLAVIIPFYEEVFYRGCLFDILVSIFKGNAPIPSIITSVIFSLMHTQYNGAFAFFVMFLISLIFIHARLKSKNIISAILLHSVMNTFFILINMQTFF